MSALERRGCRISMAVIASVFAATTYGQSTFQPYASTQYEHNNNVFALPNSTVAVMNNGDPTLGDSDLRTVVGFEEDYLLGRQRFYATLEGRYIDFDHFSYLDHYEYLVKLGLDWKLLTAFDGTFLASQEQVMPPFANRDTQTELALDVDKNLVGKFNFRIAPEWRLETSVTYEDLTAPIQGYPDYALIQTVSHVAVKYLGIAKFTYGISADYFDGRYQNAPIQGTYDQTNLDLTMTYVASGLSSFNGAIGHTQRNQGQNQGDISEVTGDLGYTRRLTGKTSISIDYTRLVNSYIAAGGSELDSTIALRVNYQPTFKTGIAISYQETWADFLGQTIPGSNTEGLTERTPSLAIKVNYQALRWLLIQPYASFTRRTATQEIYAYSGTIIGVQVLAKMPAPPQTQLR
ncbi:MAG: hypothetical protein ACLPV8_05705 [Steroidobacteraceae bacterium]